MEGLPFEYRRSLYLLKVGRQFGRFPDEVEERGQELLGHLEREATVNNALRRYRGGEQ